MDYPALPIHMTSKVHLLDDIKVSRARGGQPKARRWYSATRIGKFSVVHIGLTDAQRDELEAFLRANRVNSFVFEWPYDKSLHTVIWGDASLEWEDVGGRLSSTQLTLIPVI